MNIICYGPVEQERRASLAGFSLIEAMIYIALLAILGGPIAYTALASTRSTVDHDSFNKAAERNRVARARVSQSIRNARLDTISITNAGRELTFQLPDFFDGATMRPGHSIRYRFESVPDDSENGADDNGNGLIDEGRLVFEDLTITESAVLCESLDLTESGFRQNGAAVGMTVSNLARLATSETPYRVSRDLTVRPRN